MWAKVLTIFLGLFIVAAPNIFTTAGVAANNNYVVGPLVVTFAVTSLWDINTNVRFANLLTGAWLLASPIFLAVTPKPLLYNNLICGALIIVLCFVKSHRTHHYGGGWQSLFQKNPDHLMQSKNQPR